MAEAPRIKITRSRLLIVEGKDEEQFFAAAIERHLKISDIQVLPIGGKQRLHENLKALANDPLFPAVSCIGIVRDADSAAPGAVGIAPETAANAAFAAVAGTLGSLKLPQPTAHAIFAAGPPKVVVFIMPDGVNDGMLETLCIESAQSAVGFGCVDTFFNCLAAAGAAMPLNTPKARAHAWLAAQPEPGKRVGEAAQAGYWQWHDAAFEPLWDFVRGM